jgi:NUDIX domain.
MSILKVTALVIVRARRVLLVKHGDDFWKFPGGVVEDSDINFISAARREAREELHSEFKLIQRKPFFWSLEINTAYGYADTLIVHYLVQLIRNAELVEETPADRKIEIEWMSLDEPRKRPLAKNIIEAVESFGFKFGDKF